MRQIELDIIKQVSERWQEDDVLQTLETVMNELGYDDHYAIDDIIYWVRQHKNGLSMTKTPPMPHVIQSVHVSKSRQIKDALKISKNSELTKIGKCLVPTSLVISCFQNWEVAFTQYSDNFWRCETTRRR